VIAHRHLLRPRRSEPDWPECQRSLLDRKPAAEKPWTEKLWIYDLPPSTDYGATGRTNKHFTLKEPSSSEIDWRSISPKGQRCSADQNPINRSDFDDFVDCYNPKNGHERNRSK